MMGFELDGAVTLGPVPIRGALRRAGIGPAETLRLH